MKRLAGLLFAVLAWTVLLCCRQINTDKSQVGDHVITLARVVLAHSN